MVQYLRISFALHPDHVVLYFKKADAFVELFDLDSIVSRDGHQVVQDAVVFGRLLPYAEHTAGRTVGAAPELAQLLARKGPERGDFLAEGWHYVELVVAER